MAFMASKQDVFWIICMFPCSLASAVRGLCIHWDLQETFTQAANLQSYVVLDTTVLGPLL